MPDSPYLSVVIPTKDRNEALTVTLRSLLAQETADEFEIVVADNGSTDGTGAVLEGFAASHPGRITPVSQPAGGPAAARNAAVRAARGDVLLLLGDDTEPARPDLVRRHTELHRDATDPAFAVLGRIEWTPREPVTDFMRWLDSGGTQFHFFEIEAGRVDPANYFYSSHLSLSRTAFEAVGGFDERFPYAAIEDTDLGSRLTDWGLHLEYHPELLVWHDHPTTLERSLARMERVGVSAAQYNSLKPGRPHEAIGQATGPRWRALDMSAPILNRINPSWLPESLRGRFLWFLHMAHFSRGYRRWDGRTG